MSTCVSSQSVSQVRSSIHSAKMSWPPVRGSPCQVLCRYQELSDDGPCLPHALGGAVVPLAKDRWLYSGSQSVFSHHPGRTWEDTTSILTHFGTFWAKRSQTLHRICVLAPSTSCQRILEQGALSLWPQFPHLQRWDENNLCALHRGFGSLKGEPCLKELCKLKQ